MALVLFVVGNISMPVFAAAGPTVAVQTNAASYSGATPILITGIVSPAPGASTAVILSITNPIETPVDIEEANVNATTGSFNYTEIPGGTAAWISGTYTINATWGGPGGSAFGIAAFSYTAAVSSTTSSSSSTSTSTSTSSSSSTTSSTTTSSSTTSSATSSSTSTSSTTSMVTSTSTSTSSSTTAGSKGLGSLTYVIIAVVVIIVAGLGLVMWRRSVAKNYGTQPSK